MKEKKYIFEDVFKYFEILGAPDEKNRYLKFKSFYFNNLFEIILFFLKKN